MLWLRSTVAARTLVAHAPSVPQSALCLACHDGVLINVLDSSRGPSIRWWGAMLFSLSSSDSNCHWHPDSTGSLPSTSILVLQLGCLCLGSFTITPEKCSQLYSDHIHYLQSRICFIAHNLISVSFGAHLLLDPCQEPQVP